MVRYVLIDGELVSREWASVLTQMRKDGVYFHVNEGHRTLARQQYFWGCYQCQCCNGGNLAARPTPWAPHIRSGRFDHAIDFDNASGVINWLRAHGIGASLTVPGESWHVEANAAQLQSFYKRHTGDPYETLPKHVEMAVKAFIGARNNVRARVKDRDKFDSHTQRQQWLAKDELVKKAQKTRAKRRDTVQRMSRRARKESTRRILRKVLSH